MRFISALLPAWADKRLDDAVKKAEAREEHRARLHLLFLDASTPERLLPPVGAEEAPEKP